MARGPSEVTGFEADADRIHLLVDAVTEYAIYMLDPDGLVTSWNAGAEHLKGYGPAEIIGQPYERFFTREDQQRNVPAHILATAKKPDATRAKAGACARTACASGPQPSFTRFRTRRDGISASCKSPATSRNGKRRRTRCWKASAGFAFWCRA